MLIHGYAERAGRPLRRRIRLPRDPKSKTFQLFSTHISDEDVTAIGEHGARSTLTSHAAQRKFIAGDPDAVISLDAFIQAARHGLLDEYGADIPSGALQEIPLPEPLWIVETNEAGNRLMSVVPRLFHLDLTLHDNQVDVSNARIEGTDEMGNSTKLSNWQASVGILEAALQESAGGTALGQQDLLSSTGPRLNDFLETARTVTKQWFFSVLDDLKIEE